MTTAIKPTTGPGGSESEELVLTPGGWRPKSKVHYIKKDHYLSGAGWRLKEIETQSGKVIHDFGAIPKSEKGKINLPDNIFIPPGENILPTPVGQPAMGSGWITFASWMIDSPTAAKGFFSTEWVVPPPPSTSSGQTIFLFNGIQNSEFILQPVLQWGKAANRGGDHWSACCWYVDGKEGHAKHGLMVPVNEGDTLTGVIKITAKNASSFSYDCVFENIPETILHVQDVEELTSAHETLEAYRITKCSDYPDTQKTSMTDIQLTTNGIAQNLNWVVQTWVNSCGQQSSYSDGGTVVDLYYRT